MADVASLSVVLPVFNEEQNIGSVLEECLAEIPRLTRNFEIIPVNDGSVDRTSEVLAGFASKSGVKVLAHGKNRGYGAALRTGFAAASKEFIFFMDSDRQFDIRELSLLVNHMGEADIVVGFRKARNDSWLRKLAGWGFTAINRWMLGIRVRDLNCAFKLFRTSLLKAMPLESNGAFINAEILGRAMRLGHRIIEVPVSHFPRRTGAPTGLKPLVVLRAFGELFRLAWKIRFAHSSIVNRHSSLL